MDEACRRCGAPAGARNDLECDRCGLRVSYCSGCVSQRMAEELAGAHAARCGGRVTLSGPEVRITIGASSGELG